MDEFTDEQLDLVAKAFNNLCLKHERATSEDLVAELRKRPVTFRAGEVGWSTVIGEYLAAPKEEMYLYQGCRPLHLSEQSQALEDFVKGAVELRESVQLIADEVRVKIPNGTGWDRTYSELAQLALRDFDKLEIPQ